MSPAPDPRYPQLRVELGSANPLALIAAVRLVLRRAGVERREIQRFSDLALSQGSSREQLEVCRRWVRLGGR